MRVHHELLIQKRRRLILGIGSSGFEDRRERLQMYQIIGHGINSGIEFVIAIGSTLMIMVSNRLRVVR